jgi:hypothetical protein
MSDEQDTVADVIASVPDDPAATEPAAEPAPDAPVVEPAAEPTPDAPVDEPAAEPTPDAPVEPAAEPADGQYSLIDFPSAPQPPGDSAPSDPRPALRAADAPSGEPGSDHAWAIMLADGACAWGPFTKWADVGPFAAFVRAEVDPCVVVALRDPRAELLAHYEAMKVDATA